MRRRVVITGMGVISPVGSGINKFWGNIQAGLSGAKLITQFDTTDFAVKFAGEVDDVNIEDHIDRKEMGKMDRFTQWGVISADEAMTDAGFNLDTYDLGRFGVIMASGVGGLITYEEQHNNLIRKGPRRVSPFFIPKMIPDITAGHISIKYGLRGPNYSVSSACASANHALTLALRHIQYGDADVIVAGGSEAAVTPMAIAGFTNIKALTRDNDNFQTASKPFDKNRSGFVLSEGAGILVLEEYEHAKARGAKIYAELAGAGISGDAHHITAPIADGSGAIKSMTDAIKDARLESDNIDYINAHGTSTHMNDKIETLAIKSVFGERAYKMSISSTKSMTGHLLGAAGAIEGIVSVLAVKDGIIPPTINYSTPDPECDLNYTPNTKVKRNINSALSNTFGFGGHNASIVFKKI